MVVARPDVFDAEFKEINEGVGRGFSRRRLSQRLDLD